jgi:hypothetical protein
MHRTPKTIEDDLADDIREDELQDILRYVHELEIDTR